VISRRGILADVGWTTDGLTHTDASGGGGGGGGVVQQGARDGTAQSWLVTVNAAIAAGNNNIGDVDVVSLPALPAGTNVIGHVIVDSGAITADTELPAAAALADGAANPTSPLVGDCLLVWNGATWDRVRGITIYKDENGVTITTITTVWTPASGKKFRLMGGCISVSAACSVLFEDNAAAAYVMRTPKLLADTPYNFDLGQGKLSAAANNVLKATSSAAAVLTGVLYGTEE
jgi:hypothetical protein